MSEVPLHSALQTTLSEIIGVYHGAFRDKYASKCLCAYELSKQVSLSAQLYMQHYTIDVRIIFFPNFKSIDVRDYGAPYVIKLSIFPA